MVVFEQKERKTREAGDFMYHWSCYTDHKEETPPALLRQVPVEEEGATFERDYDKYDCAWFHTEQSRISKLLRGTSHVILVLRLLSSSPLLM